MLDISNESLAERRTELEGIHADFYKLWNVELKSENAALRDYKAEAMAWRFYLAGRRAKK
jgi:hypothetical protein